MKRFNCPFFGTNLCAFVSFSSMMIEQVHFVQIIKYSSKRRKRKTNSLIHLRCFGHLRSRYFLLLDFLLLSRKCLAYYHLPVERLYVVMTMFKIICNIMHMHAEECNRDKKIRSITKVNVLYRM